MSVNWRDTYEGEDVLVTGGAGFIGSHLVESLVAMGASVTVLDNLSTGRRGNLAAVTDEIDFRNGSVTDAQLVDSAVEEASLVFHLAANASVPTSVDVPTADFETNACGTQVLLNAARQRDIDRVLIASSAAVYGDPIETPMDESHPLSPRSPYGASKLAAEQLGFAYAETYGLSVTAARIFNSYGPRQPRYVMYDFLEKLRSNPDRLEVLGTGKQTRQYCYITDTVRALELLCATGETKPYNVAGDDRITIRELAERMVELIAPGAEIEYGHETWDGDITTLAADTTRLNSLGFEPSIPLDYGLRRLIEWYGQEIARQKVE